MASQDAILDFWKQAQITCREYANKTKYQLLSGDEALMYQKLCRMLKEYFEMQELLILRDKAIIKKDIENAKNNNTAEPDPQ